MAKTTATIFGLVLAAVSIGVNTWRFPIVWQMADPQLASRATDSPAPEATVNEQPVPDAHPAALPNMPVAIPSMEQNSTSSSPPIAPPEYIAPIENLSDHETSAEGDLPAAEYEGPPDEWEDAPPIDEEPLVPVNFAGVSRGDDHANGDRLVVRRLPPVVQTGSPPINNIAGSFNGSMPVYPSTGIE